MSDHQSSSQASSEHVPAPPRPRTGMKLSSAKDRANHQRAREVIEHDFRQLLDYTQDGKECGDFVHHCSEHGTPGLAPAETAELVGLFNGHQPSSELASARESALLAKACAHPEETHVYAVASRLREDLGAGRFSATVVEMGRTVVRSRLQRMLGALDAAADAIDSQISDNERNGVEDAAASWRKDYDLLTSQRARLGRSFELYDRALGVVSQFTQAMRGDGDSVDWDTLDGIATQAKSVTRADRRLRRRLES